MRRPCCRSDRMPILALRIPDVFSRWVGDDVPVVTIVPVEAPAVRVAGPAPAKPQLSLPRCRCRRRMSSSPCRRGASTRRWSRTPWSGPAPIPPRWRATCSASSGAWAATAAISTACGRMTSRRAMKAFTDRVNAALPVDDARCDPALARQGASGRCLRQALSCARGARRGRTLPADRGPGPPQQEGRTAWRTGEGQGTGRAARGRDQRLDDHGVGAAAAASCRGTAAGTHGAGGSSDRASARGRRRGGSRVISRRADRQGEGAACGARAQGGSAHGAAARSAQPLRRDRSSAIWSLN